LTAFNKDNVPTTRALQVQVRTGAGTTGPLKPVLEASSPKARIDAQGMRVAVGQPVIFKWQAENAQRVRIETISPTSLEGVSGQKTAELRGTGTYTFTLVATNDRGQEFKSQPVVIRAECNRSWLAELTTAGLAGCKSGLELVWK
jgi:hypothetical protein